LEALTASAGYARATRRTHRESRNTQRSPNSRRNGRKNSFDPEEVVKVVGAKALQFQPGERHGYCNTNYFLSDKG